MKRITIQKKGFLYRMDEYNDNNNNKVNIKGNKVGSTLSKMSGHYEYTALQSNTQLGTETEMLINIIDLLVNAGNLSEIEGIKVKHLISNDKGRRL